MASLSAAARRELAEIVDMPDSRLDMFSLVLVNLTNQGLDGAYAARAWSLTRGKS